MNRCMNFALAAVITILPTTRDLRDEGVQQQLVEALSANQRSEDDA